MDALLQGLLLVMEWPVPLYIAGGILIGIALGLLPGLGSVFGLVVLLPFTFTLEPMMAIALLVTVHSVSQLGGEVTSILFGVPGEASAAASIVDGHPLAKDGQAGFALGASVTASILGGLVGALVLILFIPIARPAVLALGNPELFMLIMLGVMFVASMAGKRPLLGYTAAMLGFTISFVGISPTTGASRLTFGQPLLWEGIPLVPVVLGMFAVPELYDLYRRGTSIGGAMQAISSDVRRGVFETFRRWKLVLSTSLLGVLIGIIPGLGASVSQWVAYGYARQRSSTPARFGKGAIEGVIAPGAASNSKEGGQLIPTLFFGIPGGVGMAILLAALLIIGVTPGPNMLSNALDFTFAMFWIVVLSHLVAGLFVLALLKQLAKVTAIQATYLIPVLLALVMVGGYQSTNSMWGIGITFIAGVVGELMARFEWSRPAFVLSFILGGLAERYLFISTQTFGAAFLLRPGVVFLMLVIVFQMVMIIRRRKLENQSVDVL